MMMKMTPKDLNSKKIVVRKGTNQVMKTLRNLTVKKLKNLVRRVIKILGMKMKMGRMKRMLLKILMILVIMNKIANFHYLITSNDSFIQLRP